MIDPEKQRSVIQSLKGSIQAHYLSASKGLRNWRIIVTLLLIMEILLSFNLYRSPVVYILILTIIPVEYRFQQYRKSYDKIVSLIDYCLEMPDEELIEACEKAMVEVRKFGEPK